MDNDLEWNDVFGEIDFSVANQRGAERHGVAVQVAYAYGDERYRAFSSDISQGGLFVATEQPLPEDETFKLVFKLPIAEEPIRAVGRVAWVRDEVGEAGSEPAGFGVEFLKITDNAPPLIEQFLELRAAMLSDDDPGV